MNKITVLKELCGGCPMIWNVQLPDGSEGYLKYRWGEISLKPVTETAGILQTPIISEKIGDDLDGMLDIEDAVKWLQSKGYEVQVDLHDVKSSGDLPFTKGNLKGNYDNPKLSVALSLFPQVSIMEMVRNDCIQKASKQFESHLQDYIRNNLLALGFVFPNEKELVEFVSKRVHRIGFENRPNYFELYLDYQTENQTLIGMYNDNVSISYEGSNVTVTFGRSVG